MKKILFIIIFSLLISFSFSFTVIQIFYQEQKISQIEDEKKYFESLSNIEKKIFLVGTSEIQALNPFYIENLLQKNNHTFYVYNLSKGATHPERYLESMDFLISAKPDIVVYGISARDFNDDLPILEKPSKPLLEPSRVFQNFLTYVNSNFLNLPDDFNPKLITLKKIRGITENSYDYPKAPFYRFDYTRNFNTQTDEELKTSANTYDKIQFRDSEPNHNQIAFKKIIDKLKENNIKIILFTTPQHKYAYNLVEKSDKLVFENILQDISDHSNTEINSFTDKYSDMDVWRNLNHIVTSESSLIYSDDIGNLILQELQ